MIDLDRREPVIRFIESMREMRHRFKEEKDVSGNDWLMQACFAFADEECSGTHLDEGWCGDPDAHNECRTSLFANCLDRMDKEPQ